MSIYRNTIWFFKGLKEYTKGGYAAASKNFESLDGLKVDGKSFMITGANSGIGKEAAIALAAKGGTVHMVCRNEERGKKALEEVKSDAKSENVYLHLLDMSNSQSVQKFANEFIKSKTPLHVLVNNAGCMVNERITNDDGVELNFATNTLGTYILTESLLDHIKKHDHPTVITVTSGGMLVQKLEPSDFNSNKITTFDGTFVYAQNKRQQVVMTEQWAVKHKDVKFLTMHPGWADTPAVQMSMPDFHRKMQNRLRTPAEGADTLVWACVSPSVRDIPSGSFLQDRVAVAKHLPLAATRSAKGDDQLFMTNLEQLAKKVLL